MYQAFFGLKSNPFRLDPNLDFIYTSEAHQESIAHLCYGIEQGEDFVLITGAVGIGKTLALHFLLDQITSSYHTAFINVTLVDFRELLKMILSELKLEFDRQGDMAELLGILKKHFLDVRRKREKILLVVDEAQNLDVETLEGIRILGNLAQPGGQVLQTVLAGQPGLTRTINRPELEQLRQRIRVRYNLKPLAPEEVGPYIAHRLRIAGCERSVFSKQAVEKIRGLSRGIPRLVNKYADRAMLAAFVEEAKVIGPNHVKEDEEVREDAQDNPLDEERRVVAPVDPSPEDRGHRAAAPNLVSLLSDDEVEKMVDRAFEVEPDYLSEAVNPDQPEAKQLEANKSGAEDSHAKNSRKSGKSHPKGNQSLFSVIILFLIVVVSLSFLAGRFDLIPLGSRDQSQLQKDGEDVGLR